MAHLTGIGIENFRVFKDYTEFDFAPITILTGANNSGKSSLFKALLLLKDSFTGEQLEELDFKKGSHKAGDMNNVLNNKEKPLILYFPFKFFNSNDLVISFEFTSNNRTGKNFKSECSKIIIYYKNNFDNKQDFKPLLEVFFKDETVFTDLVWFKNQMVDFCKSKVAESELQEKERKERAEKYLQKINKPWSDYPDGKNDLGFFIKSVGKIEEEMILEGEMEREEEIDYEEEIAKKVERAWLSFEEKQTITLFETRTKEFAWGLTNKNDYYQQTLENLQKLKDEKLKQLSTTDLKKWQDETGERDIREFYRLNRDEFLTVYDIILANFQNREVNEAILESIKKTFNGVIYYIKRVAHELAHLVSVRGTNERIYKDNSALGEILQQLSFQNIYSNSKEITRFANYWVKKFEIKHFDRIIIDNHPDLEIVLLYLQEGEDKKTRRFVIDLGFGSQQLITILLKIVLEGVRNKSDIYTMPDYQPKTLLIEEPEANLHPKYQSLLADMLIDAADKFNIQFIIETHSEYLIRKLQYWVAKGTIKPTDVALYYLNDPESENVKNGKARQVERIEIKEDGSIEENYEKYWSGFFDEITTLKDKLQQAQLEVDIKRLKEELDKIKGNTKCIVLTEDSRKDSIENLEVLFKSSGFNWSEVECYSYGGCTKVNAIQFLTDYFNKKSLPMSFVVHRDRDYKSEEEIEKWIKNIKKLKGKLIKIHPFVTQGTMVESYFLNANHINAIYPQISVSKAQDFIDEVKDNVATVSIDKMKKEFLLDKNNNKVLTDKEINQKYNNERDRYIYGKVACGLLKSKVQEEIKENCLLNQYSIFIKDTNLEQIAKEIWS